MPFPVIFSTRAHLLAGAALIGALALPVAAQAQAPAPDADAQSSAIVVTAAGYEQNIIEAPASITVLGREELQEKRFGSLAEALQDVQASMSAAKRARPAASTSRSAACPATIRWC